MNMKKIILLIIIFCCCFNPMAFGRNLKQDIENIVKGKQVGVAVISGDNVFTFANDNKYPIMSVFKFHIAVTALKKMEAENIPLDKMVYIEKEEILENTYSPLRDKYPNQRIHISYRDILEYTVSHSDNNTCDWLIRFVGGIDKVDTYIKSLGINDMNFTETEEDMHLDIMKCYNNWSTPLALAQLLKKIYTGNILSDEHFTFLETVMLNCSSGKDKLRAGLPQDINIGHKTGRSDRRPDDIQISDADIGVVYLPNGEKYYIAVLVKDSRASYNDNARTIADIGNIVYHYLKK